MSTASAAGSVRPRSCYRVELGVFDVNPAAIACYERVGFRRDGVRRDSFLASAEPPTYWSEVIMSVLDAEQMDRND